MVKLIHVAGPKVTAERLAPHLRQIIELDFNVLFKMMGEQRKHVTSDFLPTIKAPTLILAGRTADKPEIAARMEFIGAGIDLKTDRPSAATIGSAVRRILSTDGYRDAARKVSSEMAATTPLDTIARTLAELDAADLVRPLVSGS
jgi:hypothetical protein